MPRSPDDLDLDVPEWVEELENECLREILIESLFTRAKAIRFGAWSIRRVRNVILSADATVEQIRMGRYRKESDACNKATTTMRKYASAYEHVTRKLDE